MSVFIQSCCDDLPVVIRTVLRECLAYVSEAAVHGYKVHLEGDRDTWLSTTLMDFSGTEMSFQSEKAVWRGVLLEILFWWCCAHVILRKSSSFAKCLPGHPAWKSVIKLKRPSGSVTSEGYLVWLYQWRLFFAIILLISGADFFFFLNSVNVIQGEGTIWAVRQEADECLPKACPLLWVCGGWLKWLYLSYRWRW